MTKEGKQAVRDLRKVRDFEKKAGLYYTAHPLMGNPWATWIWLIGARGRGKSYSAVEIPTAYYKKYGPENVKIYYFRISDLSIKALLANHGRKAVDPGIVMKYGLELTTKNNTLFDRGKPFIDFYALVSAAKVGKGVAEYDPNFLNNRNGKKRFIFIIIDEFMLAEGIEKKSIGNPVDQFKIFIENILRDQEQLDYRAVTIFGCANEVSECNDFLAQLFGFIPPTIGRYRLKRKHCLIDVIPNTEAYRMKRARSIGADIMDYKNDPNYTNKAVRDFETLKKKEVKLKQVTSIIKFSKDSRDWFTVWDGKIIKRYSGQPYRKSQVIAMRRYLDHIYDPGLAASVVERYDCRSFLYNDLISQKVFAARLKEIKK